MYLYKLVNKVNGKAYIGTSVNPISYRVSRHVYAAKTGRVNMAITHAIRKYGIEAFTVERLAVARDYETLLGMEQEAIMLHNTMVPFGYNITEGGRGARRPCSPETREAISQATKGRVPWNKGTAKPKELRGYHPWNKGIKLGPMSKEEKKKRSEGAKRARATKFWSTRPKGQNHEVTIQ